jgi:predicted MFS family arabinose efflux permease
MPISHAMIASDVAPERRGIAQGVAQNLGSSLLGSFAAPVLLVAFAEAFGWRSAFYLAGIPGIVSAILLWFLIDEPAPPPRAVPGEKEKEIGIVDVLLQRKVWVCVVLGVLLVSYLVICWAFMPLFLTQARGYAPDAMGWLMGTLGVSAAVAAFVITGLSDRIGRRPVMIAMPFVAMILPLAALYYQGPAWMMALLFFIGWSMNGIFPMFMATVPSESVDPLHTATALGLTMGVAEVLGGVFAPSLAGMAADATDLSAPLWIMLGLTILSGLVAMFLEETAPSQVTKRA